MTGNNSIIERAAEAKELTEKDPIVKQARADILAKMAGKKGADLTETEIKNILKKYFTEDSIPASLSTGDPELTTIDGGYKVNLSEIIKGIITENDE